MTEFVKARGVMRDTLLSDRGLMIAYEASVAMLLNDRYGVTEYETRNQAAKDILTLIFDFSVEEEHGNDE